MKHFRPLLTVLFACVPVAAQFGVPGNGNAGTSFQDLYELAKKEAKNEASQDNELEDLMKSYQGDTDSMNMDAMMEEVMKKMEEGMKIFADGFAGEHAQDEKSKILKSLEASGTVSEEELEKMEADPGFFKQNMQGLVSQAIETQQKMQGLVSQATETLKGFSAMANDPDSMPDLASMMGSMGSEFDVSSMMGSLPDSDEELEQLRLQLLSEDLSGFTPLLNMIGIDDIEGVLNDPSKFKDMIKTTV